MKKEGNHKTESYLLQDLGDQLPHQGYGAHSSGLLRAVHLYSSDRTWTGPVASCPCHWRYQSHEGIVPLNLGSGAQTAAPGTCSALSLPRGQGLGYFPVTLCSSAPHYSLCFLALVVGTPPGVSPGFPFCQGQIRQESSQGSFNLIWFPTQGVLCRAVVGALPIEADVVGWQRKEKSFKAYP